MTLRYALTVARLRLLARHIAASKRPIILGPWRSEVGFEVLYWLPFLSQLRQTYGWDKQRLIALSRGGMGALYDTAGHADLFQFLPVETVRLHTWRAQQTQASVKQLAMEPWERNVAQLAASAMGLHNPIIFHPSWMYRILQPFWFDSMTTAKLSTWIDPKPIPALPLPEGLKLPDRFIAVRIYGRSTLEPHDGMMLSLRQALLRFAQKQPLVFLTSDERYDDHADLIRPFANNMADISAHLKPTNNLAVQAAVLQRAALCITTYGGLSQLALRMGIPTLALYSKWQGTAFAHLDLSQRLALSGNVPFNVVNTSLLERFEQVL
jgi:hypothetical protein